MNLFNPDTHEYTLETLALENELRAALSPVMLGWINRGYSPREVQYLANVAANDIHLEALLGWSGEPSFALTPIKREEPKQELPTTLNEGAYLRDPSFCPYCKSPEILAGSFDGDGQEVYCESCGKGWFDIYVLVGIETIPDGAGEGP